MTDTKEEEKTLLTSQQARNAFIKSGLSEATFHRRVQSGEIESILPVGRQRGAMYPREQVFASIDRSRKKNKQIKLGNILKPATFSKATIQDMPEVGELLQTFFSKIKIEKRIAWIEKNPEICGILRSEGRIIGCAFVMPIVEEKIMRILNATVKPPTRTQDIATYETGKHYSLYVRSVVVLQSVSKTQRRYWGARLIGELIKDIVSLGERGVIIDKVYAQTDSKHVEHLLKMIGFSQLDSPNDNKNFMLDVAASGSVFAMQYKKALNSSLEE